MGKVIVRSSNGKCALKNTASATPIIDQTARWLAGVFVLYGLTATGLLATNMPPFQNPDELAHFLRAAQLADGVPIGTRYQQTQADGSQQITSGGKADPALLMAFEPFSC
jgi:hypothetical protein